MKIQNAFQSINFFGLSLILCYQRIPIGPDYRKTTVKATFYQFSFPDDPISHNTIRKRYIQNEQELSLFTLWAQVNHQLKLIIFFLLDPVLPILKKKKLLDNTVIPSV